MYKLKKEALKASSEKDFINRVISWLPYFTRRYPQLKSWTKRELSGYYSQIKGGQNGYSNKA